MAESIWASLGASPMQCFKRFGRKVSQESHVGSAKQVKFESDDFTVTALFVRNKAQYLHFAHRGVFDESGAITLLEQIGTDASLSKESRSHQRVGNKLIEAVAWPLVNGLAVFSPLSGSLTICDETFAEGLERGEYDSVAGVVQFQKLMEQFTSAPALTAGEVATQEAAFAAEEAADEAQRVARQAAAASQKAALTALQAQRDTLSAQIRALDSQSAAMFQRDPRGSQIERSALQQSRSQLLRARDNVDREIGGLRSKMR